MLTSSASRCCGEGSSVEGCRASCNAAQRSRWFRSSRTFPAHGERLEPGEEGGIDERTPGLLVEREPAEELAGDERDVAGPSPGAPAGAR